MMSFSRLPLIALVAAVMGSAVQLPAIADVNVQINIDRQPHHSRRYHRYPRVPTVRYTYPDGRVVERYGYPQGQREVLILPSPAVVQYPVTPPPIVREPVYLPQQTQEPRLLHGQDINPINALVVGAGHLSGREGPGAVYSALTTFVPGQTVIVTRQAGGGDGYDWFLVASGEGQYAWIRGDRLSFYEFR